MHFDCPNCRRVLEFSGERPAFCSFCGSPLPASADLHEAATLAGPSLSGTDGIRIGTPQTVGEYQLLRKLGQGGMGSVWEAEQQETGRRVALKLLAPDLPRTVDTTERFFREARLAASISHPRSTFVMEAAEERGQPYIVMELMPGQSLKDVVAQVGPLPVSKAVDHILDVIEGLRAAHALGVIHRDVKPSNCFVDSDGRIKVGDYGLSKSLIADSHLTSTGSFLGTPAFAAPEQVKGGKATELTDLYSVGATLFYLITGRAPFAGDLAAVIAQIVSDPAPDLRSVYPAVPPELSRIVAQTLAKDPARRFASLALLQRALLPYASGGSSIAEVGRRVAAYFVDGMIIAILNAPLIAIIMVMGAAAAAKGTGRSVSASVEIAALTNTMQWVQWLLALIYFTLCEGIWGRTIGKRCMGLRVIGSQGGNPGLIRALGRYFFFAGQFGLPLVSPLLQTAIPGWLPLPVEASALTVSWYCSYLVMPLCLVTMRNANGYRGLHDLFSGTRVVRLHPATVASVSDVPIIVPVALDDPTSTFGPFRATGTIGRAGAVEIQSGSDQVLQRPVWIHLAAPDAAPLSSARRHVSRPVRPRWLQGGQTGGRRWEAFEAVVGSPLPVAIPDAGELSWDRCQNVLRDLAEELVAADRDGTLPVKLNLDQVWIDHSGQVKLLEAPLESETQATSEPAYESPPPAERAVGLLRQATDLCLRRQLLAQYVGSFAAVLKSRPAGSETLAWAAQALREMTGRRSTLKWDDRFGVLCCSAGTETLFYTVLFALLTAVAAFIAGLAAYAGRAGILGGLIVAALFAGLAVPALLGYWFRGGPVFRLVGIDVLQMDGQPAGRLRCAVRNMSAWAPRLILGAFFGVMFFSMGGSWKQLAVAMPGYTPPKPVAVSANETRVADVTDSSVPEKRREDSGPAAPKPDHRPPVFTNPLALGFFCLLPIAGLLEFVGIIWSLVRPQRGLQDLLARTYLAPR